MKKYKINIAIISFAALVSIGLVSATFGTWFPTALSSESYGYSKETYALQDNYDYAVSSLETASNARILAEQAFNESLKSESAAKQSLCALQISLGNSKLKDVGDKDPAEATRLQASVAEGAKCLLLESPAFTQ